MSCDCANGHVPIGHGGGWVSLSVRKPAVGMWVELYDSAFDKTDGPFIWSEGWYSHLDGDYTAWRVAA